jgi:NhaP-type Na+/H+ or K+/H+ antiporter
MFTLGVSLMLFYRGLNLSLPLLRRVWVGLGMLVVPGVVITTVIVGRSPTSCSTCRSRPRWS